MLLLHLQDSELRNWEIVGENGLKEWNIGRSLSYSIQLLANWFLHTKRRFVDSFTNLGLMWNEKFHRNLTEYRSDGEKKRTWYFVNVHFSIGSLSFLYGLHLQRNMAALHIKRYLNYRIYFRVLYFQWLTDSMLIHNLYSVSKQIWGLTSLSDYIVYMNIHNI